MIEKLERALMISVCAFAGVVGMISVGRGLRFGVDFERWPPLHPLADWEAILFWPSVVVSVTLMLLLSIGRWLAPIVASYHEGRALFVHRIVAGREHLLLERIHRLERLLAHTAVRDGVLHARGLEITDEAGAPLLTVAKSDRGATVLTVGGECRRTAACLIVTETGASLDLHDDVGRLRLRAAVNRNDVWVTLSDAKLDPRAGFLVVGGEPKLLLDGAAGSPVGDVVTAPKGGAGDPPGYL